MRNIGQAKIVTARKNYGCDACTWLTESGLIGDEWFHRDMSFAEKRAIVKARKNGWRIMKGEKCLTQTFVSCNGSDIITWRAIPEINIININHDIYADAETC